MTQATYCLTLTFGGLVDLTSCLLLLGIWLDRLPSLAYYLGFFQRHRAGGLHAHFIVGGLHPNTLRRLLAQWEWGTHCSTRYDSWGFLHYLSENVVSDRLASDNLNLMYRPFGRGWVARNGGWVRSGGRRRRRPLKFVRSLMVQAGRASAAGKTAEERVEQARTAGRASAAARAVRITNLTSWLREVLRDGPQSVTDLRRDMPTSSWGTVLRAKRTLNVTSRKDGASWMWALPQDGI